jgi:hypothetical protein
MAYEDEASYSGQKTIQTFGGRIKIEENRGRMIITDPVTNIEKTVVDINGFRVNDPLGNELTRLDDKGLTTTQADGITRIRTGTNPSTGDVGSYITKPGLDVLEELEA